MQEIGTMQVSGPMSSNSSDPKGSMYNPYSLEEFEYMINHGQWTSGAYVEEIGYVGININVNWNPSGYTGGCYGTYSSPYSALAFEDWNGYWAGGYVYSLGYVPNSSIILSQFQNVLGDDSHFVNCSYPYLGNLSEEEVAFFICHPQASFVFLRNSSKAIDKTKSESGEHNGRADAIRHCYWSALNYMRYPSLAVSFGNAHENRPKQPSAEKNMDLHNNADGYSLGKQAIQNGWTEEQLFEACTNAANSGILQLYLIYDI